MNNRAVLCVLATLPALAHAQPEAQITTPPARGLGFFSGDYEPAPFTQPRFEFEPFIWYASPGGDVGFPGSELVHTQDLSIDDPRLAPGAEIHYRQGHWRFSLLGAITSQHGGSVADAPLTLGSLSVAPGDTLVTEFNLDTFGLSAAYRIWGFASDPDNEGVPLFRSSVEAVAGLRAYDYELRVERISGAPASESGNMFQIEPILGAAWMVQIDGAYTVDLAVNFGALPVSDHSSSSLDITAGFRYAPTPSFAAQIGYRLLVFDLESNNAEAEGALAGLYGGIVLSF